MKQKNLIFINLNKTILNDEEKIDLKTINTLKKLRKINKLIIYTSNSINYLKKILGNYDLFDYYSAFNGNYIISKNNIVINDVSFNQNILNCIYDYCKKQDIEVEFETKDGLFKEINSINKCYRIIINNVKQIRQIKKIFNLKIINNKYLYPKNTNNVNALLTLKKQYTNYKSISFGNGKEDLLLLKTSDIGIKMKNSKNLKEIFIETLDDNNNDGVANFLINYYNLNIKTKFNNVKILDCTLRDGGHLNDCNFGEKTIKSILNKLINAKIDYIELGFLENCNYNKNITKFNKIEDANNLLSNLDTKQSNFSILLQVDRYDINKLTKCDGKIKLIRISFHKEYVNLALNYIKQIKKLGYDCSINPINFSNYSNYEIIELSKKLQDLKYDYFTIVDTFGTMLNEDFKNKLNLLNSLLTKKAKIGLHLHDNLSSSFSTAQILMQRNTEFGEVIIDSSINGMGRTPGNLKTELLSYYLNHHKSKKYEMKYIYDLMETDIFKLKMKYDWGLDFKYSISAFEKVHRTYSEYLQKNKVNLETTEKLLKKLDLKEKERYKEDVIENLLKEMN